MIYTATGNTCTGINVTRTLSHLIPRHQYHSIAAAFDFQYSKSPALLAGSQSVRSHTHTIAAAVARCSTENMYSLQNLCPTCTAATVFHNSQQANNPPERSDSIPHSENSISRRCSKHAWLWSCFNRRNWHSLSIRRMAVSFPSAGEAGRIFRHCKYIRQSSVAQLSDLGLHENQRRQLLRIHLRVKAI